jgi:hypothetical protein
MGKIQMDAREDLLQQLNETASQLIETYHNLPNPNLMVYHLWSVKDVLAHLVFWHESFARNVRDLAKGRKPSPLKGRLSDLNQSGVEGMHNQDLQSILQRFQAAQQIIREDILNPNLLLIPYRLGSRDYTPDEHLNIVDGHINLHLRDIHQALKISVSKAV